MLLVLHYFEKILSFIFIYTYIIYIYIHIYIYISYHIISYHIIHNLCNMCNFEKDVIFKAKRYKKQTK